MKKTFLLLILTISFAGSILGQSEDFQSWNMLAISKKLNSKYSTSLTAIYRINDKVSRFNDVSLDWKLNRKIKKGLSTQVTFRNWVFTQNKPVYFLWYDLVYVYKQPLYKWVNVLRIHHGLDWVGKEQADFIRMRNHFFHKISNKNNLTPFVGYDLWYRLNGQNKFHSLWMEAGLDYTIKKLKLRLNFRRIGYFKNRPGLRRNIIVSGVFYQF